MTAKMCKRGHPRTPENVNKKGYCLVCWREMRRDRHARGEYADRNIGPALDPAPFLAWLERWRADNPQMSWDAICGAANVPERRLREVRTGRYRPNLRMVSRILDAAGEYPHTLHELYPLDGAAPLLPEPPRFREHTVFCGFRGCLATKRGHGPLELFCREHGPVLERIRAEFEVEDESWGRRAQRRARARRWGHDLDDTDELEDAA